MKKIMTCCIAVIMLQTTFGQQLEKEADSLKEQGLLMPALMKYGSSFMQNGSEEISYKIASTAALLWTSKMRDTAFYFLNYAVRKDSTLKPLYDPQFLSLINDPRWKVIEDDQIRKYEMRNGAITNKTFAKELFEMIIKDQGFMYAGNIERRKYMENGGYFSTPAIFPLLALEEKNMQENKNRIIELLDKYGWPTASQVTEYAAAGAALIINHGTYEMRSRYFPMLEEAFKKGEAQPLRYAKMQDRLLIEEGKEQLYGTQIRIEHNTRKIQPVKDPQYVDQRRAEIGLGPLAPYLKNRFDIDWEVLQENNKAK
ncbi:DUF6624 domain-containing protein [Lutimonas sp.]|uniref:DUF6624 domain-containing protein n=1 Tax=Lutimonas sp. TaxID=1872403 RepID=UPI003D9B1F07